MTFQVPYHIDELGRIVLTAHIAGENVTRIYAGFTLDAAYHSFVEECALQYCAPMATEQDGLAYRVNPFTGDVESAPMRYRDSPIAKWSPVPDGVPTHTRLIPAKEKAA